MLIAAFTLLIALAAIGAAPVTTDTNPRCTACVKLVNLLDQALDSDAVIDCLAGKAIEVCEQFGIEDTQVCSDTVYSYQTVFAYIVIDRRVTNYTICTELLGVCDFPPDNFGLKWTLPLPDNKPSVVGYPNPSPTPNTIRVLQLADIHFDDKYIVGSEAQCGEPCCCRLGAPYLGPNGTANTPAGYWGSTLGPCDIPIQTLENALAHAANNLNVDLILWTGDLMAHNIWGYTEQHHLEGFQKINAMFQRYFPTTPIVAALGNHEGVPCNLVPANNVPPEYSHDWLYNSLSPNWLDWLKSATTSDAMPEQANGMQTRASYTVDAMPGLRIISLNTIYAYTLNFWMYMNETDPDGTMTWLINELTDAEQAGDKVWIIGHIPNSETLPSWSKLYYDMINRFEDTIRGQFFGHTHDDEFNIFYENLDPTARATSVEYICPSVTTFSYMNPVLRVYTVDKSNQYTVLDHENWVMDIEAANAAGPNVAPVWTLEYTAKNAYQLSNLNPQAWNDLTSRMLNDPTFAQQYLTYKNRKPVNACDNDCVNSLVCQLRRARAPEIPGTLNALCANLTVNFDEGNVKKPLKPLTASDIKEINDLVDSIPQCSSKKQ